MRVDSVQGNSETSKGSMRIPGCVTDLTVIRNGSLYANSNIAKGEIIEIARAVRIPQQNLRSGEDLGKFVWRVYYADGNENVVSGYALFLFGRGSFYTGFSGDGEDESSVAAHNVNYAWWDVSMLEGSTPEGYHSRVVDSMGDICAGDENECSSSINSHRDDDLNKIRLSAGNNTQCSEASFVSFSAARDIEKGELLVLDLFIDPNTSFKYATSEFTEPCMI